MRSRPLAVAILAYLALDFSNPLVPGAVSFVSGEIETVEGAQSRSPDTPRAASLRPSPRALAFAPQWSLPELARHLVRQAT
jgi:hypothetical protein